MQVHNFKTAELLYVANKSTKMIAVGVLRHPWLILNVETARLTRTSRIDTALLRFTLIGLNDIESLKDKTTHAQVHIIMLKDIWIVRVKTTYILF